MAARLWLEHDMEISRGSEVLASKSLSNRFGPTHRTPTIKPGDPVTCIPPHLSAVVTSTADSSEDNWISELRASHDNTGKAKGSDEVQLSGAKPSILITGWEHHNASVSNTRKNESKYLVQDESEEVPYFLYSRHEFMVLIFQFLRVTDRSLPNAYTTADFFQPFILDITRVRLQHVNSRVRCT